MTKLAFRSNYAPAGSIVPSHDYGPIDRMPAGFGIVGTAEQRVEFARRMHRRAANMQEYENQARIVLGAQHYLAGEAARTWPTSTEYLNEIERLDKSNDDIGEGLPTKEKMARDIYNMATDVELDADDRLKAFRLYGETRGFVGQKNAPVVNVDARSIILVPRRNPRVDDPDREEKIIQAQARLVKDAERE